MNEKKAPLAERVIMMTLSIMGICAIMLVYGLIHAANENNQAMTETCREVLAGLGALGFVVLLSLGIGWMMQNGG